MLVSGISWRTAQAVFWAVGLAALSALGWWALPATAQNVHFSLCGFDLSRTNLSAGALALVSLRLALMLQQPLQALDPWAIMALAMTPPLVAPALFSRATASPRALTDVLAFLSGYAVVWILAVPVFLLLALGLEFLAATLGAPPLWLAVVLALGWQVSVWRPRALRLCSLRVGPSSRGTGLGLGFRAGFGCIGACWALMLAAMVGGADPRWPMVLVTLFLALERLFVLRVSLGAHPLVPSSNQEPVIP